jgi:pyruvate formate lyase activating enzyme
MTVQEVLEILLKDQVFYEESGGGVTFSGGEPLVQSRFLIALLKACQKAGINRVVDTAGFAPPTVLLEVARYTNLFLFDLKHMDSDKHYEHTGVKNEKILDNLQMISEAGSQISVRIPVISGFNSDLENLRATARFLKPLQGITEVCLLPFHKAAAEKHRRFGIPYRLSDAYEISEADWTEMIRVFENAGVRTRIGG